MSASRSASIAFLLFALALLGGCAPAERPQTEQEALAKKIESRIKLPDGARPLDSYGLNYAFADDGTIVAVYATPHWPTDAKEGESRWHESYEALPRIMDGGCSVISVSYNPETDDLFVGCNGVA
jgi:hypothetical protein